MNSIWFVVSCNRISKSSTPVPEKGPPLHSTLYTRFGAAPVVEVNMPWPAPVNNRSSQCGEIRLFIVATGKHAFVNAVLALENCRLPFELTPAVVNGVP